ncbi:MAG: hypothetical protein GYA24_11330 [Candidatus Lokiarchaeota archaeon]|nr:hypothetical protein [Candidatus Lokiarchaeota archaeon]
MGHHPRAAPSPRRVAEAFLWIGVHEKRMNANTFLRKLRVAGLVMFFGNTFLQLAWSIFSAFDLFSLVGAAAYKRPVFGVLAMVMALGFVLMFLGALLQRKVKKPEVDMTKLGDSAAFYQHQKEYAEPDPSGQGGQGKATFKFFGIAVTFFVATAVMYMLTDLSPGTFGILYRGFFQGSIAFGAVAVGFLVALVVGNVNEDVWRLYIAGYHVHESVIGLYFTCIGAPMLAISFYSLEFCIGMAFIVSGIFLVGRDWKDVVKGDILVHKSREPDYDDYMRLKAKRGSVLT